MLKNSGYAIQGIDNPSEEAQIAAVTKDGRAIKYIIDKGIDLSEKVQLAAVNRDGDTIEYIVKKGIVPSEEVQITAVTRSGRAIEYIDNPSEEVQLAVNTYGFAIHIYLIKVLSQEVK